MSLKWRSKLMTFLLLFPWKWNMNTGGIFWWAMTSRDMLRGRTVDYTTPCDKNLQRCSGISKSLDAIAPSETFLCYTKDKNSGGVVVLTFFVRLTILKSNIFSLVVKCHCAYRLKKGSDNVLHIVYHLHTPNHMPVSHLPALRMLSQAPLKWSDAVYPADWRQEMGAWYFKLPQASGAWQMLTCWHNSVVWCSQNT
jgi:hypothetical protein